MNLQPDPNERGLWVNQDWQPGTPGAFAIVAGVSDYEHLPAHDAPDASDTYDLHKLRVSALTAYYFFRWLAECYEREWNTSVHTGPIPLAKCWLLLSPTAEEKDVAADIDKHLFTPIFANLEWAIRSWFASMQKQAGAAAEASRSFFFFSGHGAELSREEQILLPTDWLAPPAPNPNKALSSRNLSLAVSVLKVPLHFFFIDACRNDNEKLRKYDLTGTPVLAIPKATASNPKCEAPILYASASGTQSFQPMSATQGVSIFGQAILEGLVAERGIRLRHPSSVHLFDLKPFASARVEEILRGYGGAAQQRVTLAGVQADDSVTQIPSKLWDGLIKFSGLPTRGGAAEPVHTVAEVRDAVYNVRHDLGGRLMDQVEDLHTVLGSEDMTALFCHDMDIYDLDEKSWRPGREAIEIISVQRSEDTRRFRFDVRVSGSFGPQWFHLTDGIRHFGCFLPSDEGGPPVFRIEMDLDYSENGPRPLTRVEVDLSPENDSPMAEAAEMWRLAEEHTPMEAAEHIDEHFLENTLRGKRNSPLGATVACLVLLRVRALDRLHDWTRNLANWFAIPDAPVLWVEQLLLSNPGAPPPREGIEFLLALFERGLPALTDVCSYARRQTETYLDSDVPTADEREELERLRKWLERGGRLGRAGGLLQIYSGEQAEIQPEIVSDPNWATGRQAVAAH